MMASNKTLSSWQATWQSWAKRIDALSLRERAFIFLCLAAILIAIADSLIITPLKLEAQALAKAQLKQNQDLKQLREQFTASAAPLGASSAPGGQDEGSQLKARLATAQQQQAQLRLAVDAGFKNLLQSQVPGSNTATAGSSKQQGPQQLPELLATLLKQHPGLSLLKLASLPEGQGPAQFATQANSKGMSQAAPQAANAASAANPGNAANAANAEMPLTWQGLELQVAGEYLDQMRYLRQLELALPRLHWGELRLWSQGDGKPVLLQVQVFLPKARAS
ncbi:hypothetical protein [Roseateles sp. PN1]|uniref:hypothetical protein n=1 Tax=Roseateles sp. PN1 TaxID=3137372 RepID=UPI0031393F46